MDHLDLFNPQIFGDEEMRLSHSGRRGTEDRDKVDGVGKGVGEMRMQFDEGLEEDDADDEYDRSQNPKSEQAPERRGKQQIRPLKPVQRWGEEEKEEEEEEERERAGNESSQVN